MSNYSFSLVTLEDLEKIKYDAGFPSNQYQWIQNWFSVFEKVENNIIGHRKKPYIITAFEGDRLVAIIPLVKLYRTYFKRIKIEFLEFLGQQWSNLGNDILILEDLDESFTDELILWIKKNISFHFLFFKYLPKNSILSSKFKMFHYAGAPFIDVASYNNYEEFSKQVYTRKFREDLRRTWRRVKRDGYEVSICREEISDSNLQQIRKIAKSKEVDGKSSLYGESEKEQFHLRMYECFPSHVVFIKFNDQPVAYGTSIDWNGERIGIDAAFDRNYRRYGAGIHCLDSTIQNSFKDRKEKLSFGLGLDTYKFQFTDKIEQYFMCFDFKYRLKSLLALPYFLYRLKKEDRMVAKKLEKVK